MAAAGQAIERQQQAYHTHDTSVTRIVMFVCMRVVAARAFCRLLQPLAVVIFHLSQKALHPPPYWSCRINKTDFVFYFKKQGAR